MTSESRSQTERVVLTLREMLLRGDFKPGERLTELSLVPLLGASRTPVRLALDRLAHEGLLEAQETTGFRVRAFALDDIWDAIEVRGVLEGTAARMAAPSAAPSVLFTVYSGMPAMSVMIRRQRSLCAAPPQVVSVAHSARSHRRSGRQG